MIRRLDNIKIVFYDKHGVALIDKLLQNLNQPVNIGGMQSRGRLIKNIYRPARRRLGKLRCKLHSLSLAARKSSCRLTELDISETDIKES